MAPTKSLASWTKPGSRLPLCTPIARRISERRRSTPSAGDAFAFAWPPTSRTRIGRAVEQRVADAKGVRGERFGWIDREAIEFGELLRIDPVRIEEQGVFAEVRDGRFQMQTVLEGHWNNFQSGSKLPH